MAYMIWEIQISSSHFLSREIFTYLIIFIKAMIFDINVPVEPYQTDLEFDLCMSQIYSKWNPCVELKTTSGLDFGLSMH